MQGQDVLAQHGTIDPFRECDLDLLHSPVEALTDDLGILDQAENVGLLNIAGFDVGADGGAAQAGEGVCEQAIAFTACLAVCCHKQIIGLQAQLAAWLLAIIDLGHELRNAINQNVLVVDRRQAFARGDDLQDVAVVLIAPHPVVRLGGERKDRMLH